MYIKQRESLLTGVIPLNATKFVPGRHKSGSRSLLCGSRQTVATLLLLVLVDVCYYLNGKKTTCSVLKGLSAVFKCTIPAQYFISGFENSRWSLKCLWIAENCEKIIILRIKASLKQWLLGPKMA